MVLSNNYFSFNGVSSKTWGIGISGTDTYAAPKREVEVITIPGRSGSLIIDGGRFEDIDVEYPCFIARGFADRFDDFRAYMMAQVGYKRLEDTYHPDEYREALFTGPIDPTVYARHWSGQFTITFTCKPQRWLKAGDEWKSYTSGVTLKNPTLFEAKPLIRVYGYGLLTVGGVSVTIASNSYSYVDIDCEIEDVYRDGTNLNSLITLNSGSFPTLGVGTTAISKANTITKIDIKPRWYTI